MQSPLEKVIDRLHEMGHKVVQYGDEYRTQCPAHHGTNLNFTFSQGEDGRLLFTCHSKKCSFEEIARALSFSPSELMGVNRNPPIQSPNPKRIGPNGKKIHATLKAATLAAAFGIHPDLKRGPNRVFPYRNPDGSENLYACRWDLTPEEQTRLAINDHKRIRYVSAYQDGYIVGKAPDRIFPIYRADELERFIRDSPTSVVRIFVCEGEKAAEKARSLGLVATCTPFGSESAAKADWAPLDRMAERYRKELELIVLPDNDAAGNEYARSLVSLFTEFKSKPVVRIVPFGEYSSVTGVTDFPAKGDICELCELLDGKDNDEICEIIDRMIAQTKPETFALAPVIEATPIRELECIWDENVESRDICFAWPDRIPYGKLILINGLGSAGKTFLICTFMAIVTSGSPWPDGQRAEQGCVIYFTTEDGIEDTISKRFRDNGGNPAFLCYYKSVANNLDHSNEEFVLQEVHLLEKLIDKIEVERGPILMVVFDPISAFTGKIDENKNNQVRSILSPLIRLAEAKNFVCIGITHPKKGALMAGSAAEGVAGSSGYVNTARRVWNVFYDKETNQRYMLIAKNNLLEDPPGLTYVINDGIVSFTDTEVKMDADQYLKQQRQEFLGDFCKSKRSRVEDVETWLTEFLHDGAKPSGRYGSGDETTVFGAGEKKGFSKNALYQAKKNLGVEARLIYGRGREWEWFLPTNEAEADYQEDFKKFQSGDF